MQDQDKSKEQLIRELAQMRQRIAELEPLKTKLQQTEEALRRAQRLEAIGQLAGGVAHNFNNILTAIMGYVGLSLDELPGDHPVANDLMGIQKTAQRAAKLTQQLLTFTRDQITDPRVINLNDLVQDIHNMLRHLINEDIELVTSPAPDLGQVKIDVGQFEHVIVNLVVNARDAMPDGGKLTIETANVSLDRAYIDEYPEMRAGNYVMLAVSDTGSGMTEEVKGHVFEPFFTTKKVGQGTGLGLATCFGIIKQNNGHISVYSEPGQGTTFKVYLPRVDAGLASSSLDKNFDAPPTGTETILLVEDEIQVRNLAARVLRMQGYNVLEAGDGEEALRAVAGQVVQLLITDVVLPGMKGKMLADRLKTMYPLLKILYISGYTDNAIVHHGISGDATNFLSKPFTPTVLAHKVRETLDKQSA